MFVLLYLFGLVYLINVSQGEAFKYFFHVPLNLDNKSSVFLHMQIVWELNGDTYTYGNLLDLVKSIFSLVVMLRTKVSIILCTLCFKVIYLHTDMNMKQCGGMFPCLLTFAVKIKKNASFFLVDQDHLCIYLSDTISV